MKKIILVSALFFLSLSAISAQSPKYEYCELVSTGEFEGSYNRKEKIKIDFGNTTSTELFRSMIDAMNTMGGKGWELVQVYTDDRSVSHWVLKRKI